MRDNKTYEMITYFEEKETLHTQNSMGRFTYKSHSPSPPREADERERLQKQSFEGKKIYFLLLGTNPASFSLLFTFFPFHEISRDIIGNSNSINEHSQLVH